MFALALVAALAGIVSFLLLQHWWTYRNFYYLARKIPQMAEYLNWPILGHLPTYFKTLTAKDLYEHHYDTTKPDETTESPRKSWIGALLLVTIDEPDQIQKVLTSKYCVDKPFFYKALFFKKGLLISNGKHWQTHRKLCDPAFNLNIIKGFVPIFNEKSQQLLKVLDEKSDGQEFNILEPLMAFALDNIMSTSMGLEANALTNKNSEFLTHTYQALTLFSSKVLQFWYQVPFIFRMSELYKIEQKHVVNGVMKVANQVIMKKDQDIKDGVFNENFEQGKPQIFIDQLFKKREEFTNEEINDEVNTIVFTGFETISNTLSTISLLMAFYPEVQEKLFNELKEVYKSQDEEVTDEILDKLPYTDMVIKEAMRYFPPVPFFARRLQKDMQLGNYTVPAQSNIVLPVVHVHRNKKFWGEDADVFRPERFAPEEFSKIHSYAYFPFSRGTRNCIGYKYAMKSMKVAMSHLFRKYKLSTTMKEEDIQFEFLIISRVSQGYNISLEKRNSWNR